MPQRLLGYAAATLSAVCAGLFTVVNKHLLDAHISALTAATWSYLLVAVFLSPSIRNPRRADWGHPARVISWLACASLLAPGFYFMGLQFTSGLEGSLLINTEAVFTAILALVFFGERMGRGELAGSAAILGGAVIVSVSGGSLLTNGLLGNGLIILGYFFWAVENNLGRRVGLHVSSNTLVFFKALAAAGLMGILSVVTKQSLYIPLHLWWVVLGSGAASLGLSLLFYYALQRIGSARTGLIASTSALWGALGATLWLGEPLTIPTVIGGIAMLVGMLGFAVDR